MADLEMVLLIITLFAMLLALIILVVVLYLVMSLRGRVGKLLDQESQGNKDTRSTRSSFFFGNKSNSSSGLCNKPDPLEVITRVPSPVTVRKRLQRLSRRLKPRQSNQSSSKAKAPQVSHQPVPPSPTDDSSAFLVQPNAEESRVQKVEPRFQRENFLGPQQEVLSKSVSWPRCSPRLPPKNNMSAGRQATSLGARNCSGMMIHSNSEMPKRFFNTVSSGSTMETDAETGIELRDKTEGYVNKDEINELLRKKPGDN